MNIISCSCGVVLDKDKLVFPETIYGYDGCVNDDRAMWNGADWVAFARCPVCEEKIPR